MDHCSNPSQTRLARPNSHVVVLPQLSQTTECSKKLKSSIITASTQDSTIDSSHPTPNSHPYTPNALLPSSLSTVHTISPGPLAIPYHRPPPLSYDHVTSPPRARLLPPPKRLPRPPRPNLSPRLQPTPHPNATTTTIRLYKHSSNRWFLAPTPQRPIPNHEFQSRERPRSQSRGRTCSVVGDG